MRVIYPYLRAVTSGASCVAAITLFAMQSIKVLLVKLIGFLLTGRGVAMWMSEMLTYAQHGSLAPLEPVDSFSNRVRP